jgi:oligopeptide/dipeptide ABC transporter ATP-binding protein
VKALFSRPQHPYTQGLIACVPDVRSGKQHRTLVPIPGRIPLPRERPAGCAFAPRCAHAVRGRCDTGPVALSPLAAGHAVRCVRAGEGLQPLAASDRFPRDKVLAVVAVSAAVTCGLIVTLTPLSPILPFVLVCVFGCTTLSIYALAVAFASARVEATYLVSLSSRLLLIYGVGAIIAPALTNELMMRFGPSALFVVLGLATFTVGSISALSNFISARKEMHLFSPTPDFHGRRAAFRPDTIN